MGYIRPNAKLTDIKGLADYLHSKGLRMGIYSSPGPTTCGGYQGSYGHEEQDAQSYAAWGMDYGGQGVATAKGFYNYTRAQAEEWERLFLKFSYAFAPWHKNILNGTGAPLVARRKDGS